ncbi:MAG: xylulokinase, partial [Acidimicrobiia bacterium]|nr:xylulokinase [Acidimicrobiia bacterium]
QSTKVLVVDADGGDVIATGRAAHEVTGVAGARETDPELWWSALQEAIAETGRGHEIAAISVAAQQHGMVVLDGDGTPLRPAKLWNDVESAPDAQALIAATGGKSWWAERVGIVPVASFTASKWAWLRRVEPHIADATRAVRLPHDFLNERLTGLGTSDRGDASGTAWWSTASEDYAVEVLDLDLMKLERHLLPHVLGPTDAAGTVTKKAAAFLGIPADIPVGPGTGDNAAAAVGLGLEPGTPVISLGTSGTAFMASASRTLDPSGTVAGFADATGRFLPLAATLNCTLAVDRFAAWLGLDRDEASFDSDVVVLPFLDGERTPNLPHAAGTIAGLRHSTTGREILLAAYRGAALSLLEALDGIDEHSSGIDPDAPIILVGGGARGRTWQRVIAELSGRAIAVPANTELVALGAAAQAASMINDDTPEAIARAWDTLAGERIDPVDRNDEALERMRRVMAATAALNG